MRKVNSRLLSSIAFVLVLGACQQQLAHETEHGLQTAKTRQIPELHYNVPPQVVYRIDDHRFVTLENYNHCLGIAWYNDTRQGIRTRLGLMWPTGFRGGVINGDPTGKNLVFPTVARNVCGDRGCVDYMAYSTDGGKSFLWTRYDRDYISFDPVKDSEDYAMVVASDRLYVMRRNGDDGNAYVLQYPLVRGIDLNKPYPPGVSGARFLAFSKSGFLAGLRTPSGADRFTCDESIHDPKVAE